MMFSTILLSFFLLASCAISAPVDGRTNNLDSRTPSGSKLVIIQMFEWTWDSIAAECTDFIGPAGYGFVQVSPPQEHITGDEWYTDYQPISYTLVSKRGDRAQFANMITTCHAAGVKVIAGLTSKPFIPETAPASSGTGTDGNSFTKYNYPGVPYADDGDFHHCGLEPNDLLVNYDNAVEVWTCELEGLADLAQETTHVRSVLAAYCNDLISLGVDGLRLDSAKDIEPIYLAAVVDLFSTSIYLTQEVYWGEGQPVGPANYTSIGDVQEFRYTWALQSAFSGGGISSLESLNDEGWIDSSVANIFVANHDTERDGNSLNYNSPSNTYVTATIFSLGYPYGTPTILSSYEFTDSNAGAPNGGAGTCTGTGGENGWLCQHRWVAFTGMVGFRNNVGSAALNNWVSPQSEQIAFGRGALGFLAINNADSAWSATFTTSLPAGSYCDVISGTSSSGSCTGSSFTVSGGSFSAVVPALSAIAIHTGALGTGSGTSTVTVLFEETATTTWGENIFLTGSISQLNDWSTSNLIALSSADYPTWTVSVSIPPNTNFQYKFVRVETDGSIVWQADPNLSATTPSSGTLTLATSWTGAT